MAKFSDNAMAAIFWDEIQLSLGTLGAGSAIISGSRCDPSRLQGFRVLKTEYFINIRGMTTGEGPILATLSHGLSATEIEQTMGADPQRSNDPDASPRAMQPLWPLGYLMFIGANGPIVLEGTTKLGWSFPEGTGLDWGFTNRGDSALTTGGIAVITAKHFGVWLKD